MSEVPGGLVFAETPAVPESLNVLLYGPPGSGKSTAAATCPGPIMWVNAEGPNALAYARKMARQRRATIFEVRLERDIDPREQMRQVIRHVRDAQTPKVETVVVDTLGKVRELLIAALVTPGSKNTLQQFGEVARALGGFVNTLRDLPVNVVLLAHEDVQDADGERIVRPLIGGALTEAVPSEMDVMAFCGVVRDGDHTRYVGQLVEQRGRRAKDRSGGLGAVRDLDLSEWIGAYRAALSVDEADIPFSEHYQPELDPAAAAGS